MRPLNELLWVKIFPIKCETCSLLSLGLCPNAECADIAATRIYRIPHLQLNQCSTKLEVVDLHLLEHVRFAYKNQCAKL